MYHRVARTERYRWWKPLVELVVFVLLLCGLWVSAIPALYKLVGPAENGAPGIIKLGLTIACALPAAFVAARLVGRPWGSLFSVDGRFRGKWFAICVAIAVANIVVSVGISAAAEALGHPFGARHGAWVGWEQFAPLAITVVIVIPLQASAEEFAFRGTLLQAVGAWVRPPWFAIVLSSVLFGLAHGLSLAGFAAITTFGIAAAWLTIRTGGLEAAIALHVMNNVTLFLFDAATGRADRWVTELNTEIEWVGTAVDVAMTVLYAAVIAKLHSRRVLALGDRPVEPLARLGG